MVSASTKTRPTRPRTVSGSWLARSGSPHRVGGISGWRRSSLISVTCYSVTYVVTSSQPSAGGAQPAGHLPGCRPRLHPRRRLAAYDPDRGGPPGGGLADDDLSRLVGHAGTARRPDDPRVERPGEVDPADDRVRRPPREVRRPPARAGRGGRAAHGRRAAGERAV